jgi:hypothetical protein
MTMNLNHENKAAPLSGFLHWLKGVGIPMNQFYFAFMVPSDLVSQYQSQLIRTKAYEIHQKPGMLLSEQEYFVALDIFAK